LLSAFFPTRSCSGNGRGVREKGEREDFLPCVRFSSFQPHRMLLRSKISASSPVRSRHFLTNDLIGESDSKASFDVLAERLLQRLCLTADFRNGFLKTVDATVNGLCCADKTRIQNLCLVLLRSIPDSELSGNLRLIEKLLSVAAVLLRSAPQDSALFDAETQSLLQAMLENEAELTRIYRTHQRSGLNALVLLSGFYAAVQNNRDEPQTAAFGRLLFVRHSFFAFVASTSTTTLLRTLTIVRVFPQEKSPVRLFLSPAVFAPVFHSRLHGQPLSFVNALPHIETPVTRDGELLRLLKQAGLVGATHRVRRWTDAGRLTVESLWELRRASVRRLFSLVTSETAAALHDAAYDFLQLESDSESIIEAPGSSGESKSTSKTPAPEVLCHPVMNGAVAGVGLPSWANAVLVRALARVDETVKTDHCIRHFFVIELETQDNIRVASASKNLPKTPSEPVGSRTEFLSALNRTLETKTVDRHFLPELPAGLFVPARFFATPPVLWLAPLEALGLAVTCTRPKATVTPFEDKEETSPQPRFKESHPCEPGVLFPFFDSVGTARWWLEQIGERSHTNGEQASRRRLLKHFLLTDVMARLLRILVLQAHHADQSVGHRILGQTAALADTPTSQTLQRELKKFLPVQHFRKVCAASFAELAHGFLAHDLQHKGRTDVATGLEAVIEAQKRQLASARSKRLKRIAARPDP
jgi:hypothetical protein